MSALTVSQDPEQSWDDLVRFWEEMEWPEGSKVEIIDDWEIFQTLAIAVPSRLGMLIPDLVVAPVREDADTDTHIPAARAELVVEVTSKSNARQDRVSKPAACATAGIPLYLLVDRWAADGPTVTLYGEPKGDVYRPLSTAEFGESIKLPAPFDLVIDTGDFPES
ncbi:Uma2 family endonuclease [Streptomyces tuirus]|uniref:Uma2 family endonuclease n=1 Tax=Streptomyces tuirus TaxID=68278 RepID=A0A941FHG4_9ACTN|nr:Uma2 family endonuclease [Streptomyces tuirus]